MVTQIIHVGDCELLEHYMDVTDKQNAKWRLTENRSLLVGFNSEEDYPDPLADAKVMLGFSTAPGSSECLPAWRGLTPLVMNPHYGQARNQEHMQPPGIMDSVEWSHFDDLRNIYGTTEDGKLRPMFDNVGVQYGLRAFVDREITAEEFLKLNEEVGGWKDPSEMVVATALADGTYGNWDPSPAQIARLEAVHPDGVCDYSQPDQGRPRS